mmetsp:Transcript_8915/g.14080  ORF Transcript_8915/g.14080 Transcript_8915/m.14080 type:complete len:345 (-) Transcript_8915:177-1211(-)
MELAAGNSMRVGLFMDLDHCAIMGQDGNDLGIAFQLNRQPYYQIKDLYKYLINPEVLRVYRAFISKKYRPELVIYTRRSHLLSYTSVLRSRPVDLTWMPDWHHSKTQVCFPSDIKNADQILNSYSGSCSLFPKERLDLRMSLERLLAARDAIKEILELPKAPKVVVTCAPKDVTLTASKMDLPSNSYLWDDNEDLFGADKVLPVARYDALQPRQAKGLREFLDETLPVEALPRSTIAFMMKAREGMSSIRRVSMEEFEYQINEEQDPEPFPLPEELCKEESIPRGYSLSRSPSLMSRPRNLDNGDGARALERLSSAWHLLGQMIKMPSGEVRPSVEGGFELSNV